MHTATLEQKRGYKHLALIEPLVLDGDAEQDRAMEKLSLATGFITTLIKLAEKERTCPR